jgi:hypothetical protein
MYFWLECFLKLIILNFYRHMLFIYSWLKFWVLLSFLVFVEGVCLLLIFIANIFKPIIWIKFARNIYERQTFTVTVFIQSVLLIFKAFIVLRSYLDTHVIIKFEWIFISVTEFVLTKLTKNFYLWFWSIKRIIFDLFCHGILFRWDLLLWILM